jgi:hypothetical protein
MDGGKPMILDLGLASRVVVGVRSHTAQRTGCPEWDTAGVSAALKAADGSPGSVLAAMLLAAEDGSLTKPSLSAIRSHWPRNATGTGPSVSHNVPCVDHPDNDMPCQHADHRGDMTPEQIAEAARMVRAALAAARGETTP